MEPETHRQGETPARRAGARGELSPPERRFCGELAELADGLTAATAYIAAILHAADRQPDGPTGAPREWAASCQEQLRRCETVLTTLRSPAQGQEPRAVGQAGLFRAEERKTGWVIIDERLNCPAVIGAQRQENLTEAGALSGAAVLNDFVGSLERRDRAFLAAAQRQPRRLAIAAAGATGARPEAKPPAPSRGGRKRPGAAPS